MRSLLSVLTKAALQADPTPPARVVVTVPASFQVAQRRDTRAAAERAGLTIAGGDLLDEPLAAFLDFAAGAGEVLDGLGRDRFNLAVLDFGGGTCDEQMTLVETRARGEEHIENTCLTRVDAPAGVKPALECRMELS